MNIVILGGKGKMGSAFARVFQQLGYQVSILDQEDWCRAESLLSNANIVLISVPIHKTDSVIEKVVPYLSEDTLLLDITSVKVAPKKAMLTHHKGPVLSLHPMFGPSFQFHRDQATSPKRLLIADCGGRFIDRFDFILKDLGGLGFQFLEISDREHDQVMAYVQGLHYFSVMTNAYCQWKKTQGIGIHFMPMTVNQNDFLAYRENASFSINHLAMEIKTMFSDATKMDLYSGLIFSDDDRIDVLKRYRHIVQNVESNQASFLEECDLLKSYFSIVDVPITANPINDYSQTACLHYYLLFCEAKLLLKEGIHLKSILSMTTENYFNKLVSMADLFKDQNSEKLFHNIYLPKNKVLYQLASNFMDFLLREDRIERFCFFYKKIASDYENKNNDRGQTIHLKSSL